jgi:hypothetical protein
MLAAGGTGVTGSTGGLCVLDTRQSTRPSGPPHRLVMDRIGRVPPAVDGAADAVFADGRQPRSAVVGRRRPLPSVP